MNKTILTLFSFLLGMTTLKAQEFIGLKKAYSNLNEINVARAKIHFSYFGRLVENDPILMDQMEAKTAYFEIDYKLQGLYEKGFLSVTNLNPNNKNRSIDQIIKAETDWYFDSLESEKNDVVVDYIKSTVIHAGYYFDTTFPFINIYFLNNNTKEIVRTNLEIYGTKAEKIAFCKDFIKKYANIKWKIKI